MTFIRAGEKSMNLFEKKISMNLQNYFTKLNCNVELSKLLQNQLKYDSQAKRITKLKSYLRIE